MRARMNRMLGLSLGLLAAVALFLAATSVLDRSAGDRGARSASAAGTPERAGGSVKGEASKSARAKSRQAARAAAKITASRRVRGGRAAATADKRRAAGDRRAAHKSATRETNEGRGLAVATVTEKRRLAATDGHIHLPGRDPLYVFGFVEVPVNASISSIVSQYKGKVQAPAPLLGVDQNAGLELRMTNIGFAVRPDLADSHTVHWHGFRNAISLFDGVPEVSIAVPLNRTFPYFYSPHQEGTYMYHCHFEDAEHVQMGMNGIVYVRPSQNGGADSLPGKYAYNDGDGSTAYNREFALMLNEIDTRPHDGSEGVQEFVWTNYKPNYWIMNGRSYPDTIKPNKGEPGADPVLDSQPISSLIQAKAGEKVLLRLANLGYQQHAMQLPGIRMKVVGEDATLLRGRDGTDLTYMTNTIYIGPGEARDVIFTAPAFDPAPSAIAGVDGVGPYNRYLFKNRNLFKLTNGGAPGLGGMATEVRIYSSAVTLPVQTAPNQTTGQGP
jgi:FtsP/CotA-like multicopper oxidase with cupredoxin domain